MIYTELVYKAINIMCKAHGDQKDKAGIPYIFHPYHVAEQMKNEECTVAALLHDVVEDTEYSFDDLRKSGIPEKIIDALKLLTHDNDVPYMDYIKALKTNETARAVKIEDLKHNMDESRIIGDVPEKLSEKRKIYKQALNFLLDGE